MVRIGADAVTDSEVRGEDEEGHATGRFAIAVIASSGHQTTSVKMRRSVLGMNDGVAGRSDITF